MYYVSSHSTSNMYTSWSIVIFIIFFSHLGSDGFLIEICLAFSSSNFFSVYGDATFACVTTKSDPHCIMTEGEPDAV